MTLYAVRSMDGLPTGQIVESDEHLCGFGRCKCPEIANFYVRLSFMSFSNS